MRFVALAGTIAIVSSASAQTVTITFEGHNNTVYSAPIVRDGYRIGNPVGQEQHFHEITSTQFGLPNNGTGVLLNDRNTEIFVILDLGGTFRLDQVDVASALNNSPAVNLDIHGFLGGNPTGTISIPLGTGYTTVLGGSLGTVDELRFDGLGGGGGFVLDNLTLTIPAPGSIALLGVAGLAAIRRRR